MPDLTIKIEFSQETLHALNELAASIALQTTTVAGGLGLVGRFSEGPEGAQPHEPHEVKRDEEPSPKSSAEVSDITDVQPRAKATEKAKSSGKSAVKSLLDEFQVGNVTALSMDRRAEFLSRLEAL